MAGKARSSQNAYKHGLGQLQKEMMVLLKEQKTEYRGKKPAI